MSQLGRFERTVQDTSGNALSGVSVTIYREGATINGNQSGTTPLTVTVRNPGKILAGDSVFVETASGTLYSVDSVTSTTIVISGFIGTLSLTGGNRLVPFGSKPTLYADDQAGATTGNPITTSSVGRAACYMEAGAYDVIYSGGAATATLLESQTVFSELTPTGHVNVRSFGATGDGSTNDTTAIQNAINEAYNNGYGIVWFPPGVYMASTLNWKRGISLFGSGVNPSPHGKGTQLKQILGTNSDFIVTDSSLATTETFHWSRIRDIYLRGQFDNGDTTGSGILVNSRSGENFLIENILVGYFPESGIEFAHGTQPLSLNNIQSFNNGAYGINISREAADPHSMCNLTKLSFDDNVTAGLRINSGRGHGSGDTFFISGVKGEKLTVGRQENIILLDTLGGDVVHISNVGGTNTSGVTANAAVKIVTSSARLTWDSISVDNTTGYSYVIDDTNGSRTWPADGTSNSGSLYGSRINSVMGVETGYSETIAAGVITVETSFVSVDTEAAAATDDLDTINGLYAGSILILKATSSARDVVVKDGTGNIRCAGDFTMDNTDDRIVLMSDGTNWLELARSNNSA